MLKYLIIPLVIIAAVVAARLSLYTVDAAEYAYVTVLGKHQSTYDGGTDDGAGLKLGWPWPIQQVQRIDRRLQQFDLPAKDELTRDPERETIDKVLSVEAYVCWKISSVEGANQFVLRIGTADRARSILAPLIVGRLGAAISERRMDDLVSTAIDDPLTRKTRVDATVEKLRQQLLDELRPQMEKEFGIELVDIRLRRFNHPLNVRDSIFQRIIAERKREAAKHLSEGELAAAKIVNEADAEARQAVARARNEEERIKADTDIEAMKIRNAAASQDPQFYGFLKQMEKLQSIVGDNRTMLLFSTQRPLFKLLFDPPLPGGKDEKKKGAN